MICNSFGWGVCNTVIHSTSWGHVGKLVFCRSNLAAIEHLVEFQEVP